MVRFANFYLKQITIYVLVYVSNFCFKVKLCSQTKGNAGIHFFVFCYKVYIKALMLKAKNRNPKEQKKIINIYCNFLWCACEGMKTSALHCLWYGWFIFFFLKRRLGVWNLSQGFRIVGLKCSVEFFSLNL